MLLNGKVAVITGASMGIGEALAKLFADEGAAVVMSSRDVGRVESARAQIGHPDRTMAVACDVRNREEIERLMALTVHNFGRVDIWVNNAGYGLMDTVANMDIGQCRAMYDTNVFGTVNGMQVAAAQMTAQRSGTIINISSVAGHIPLPVSAAYASTKAALNVLGRAARLELRKYGVNVLTVCPGFIATHFHENVVRAEAYKNIRFPVKGASAEGVARAALKGYLKGKREVVVPGYYRIFIKLYQLFPGLVELGMLKIRKPADETVVERVSR